MASEPSPGPAPSAETEATQARPMSRRRRRKLLVVLLVVAVAFVIVFWGWSSTGRNFLGVGTLVDDTYAADPPAIPSKYLARTIEVQGNVADWYSGANFTLVDKVDPSKSIAVHMLGAFPEGFEIGKTVVVKGTLDSALPLTMHATEITVGCASKY